MNMRTITILAAFAMTLTPISAGATCTIKVGYIDQHRPPYYIGAGGAVPASAGASIDLTREIAASAGCEAILVRLPLPRLRAALASGAIDAMPMDASDDDAEQFALPKDKAGRLDRVRAMHYRTVVFVRASDMLPADTDPAVYFKTHTLGINHGAAMVPPLQAQGYRIDEGALDTPRNLEKLMRKRVDGYAASVIAVGDFDRVIAARFGDRVLRLEKPLRVTHIWLAVNKSYYARNPKASETMWNWIGTHSAARFAVLVKRYQDERQD